MAVKARPVHLDSEQKELLNTLERNLNIPPDTHRFDWLYYRNPCGTAWSWFIYEPETQKIVGSASVFPRAMWVGREIKICGQVGHFSIDASHRGLGPAVMLQRATFEPVTKGALAFCYDCPPHEQGMSTFHRLGFRENCQMHRYARLLKVDRQLKKRVGRGIAPFAPLGNLFLALRDLRRHRVPGIEISRHTDRFGEEFSLLDQQVAGDFVIRSRRRTEDLNWRYKDDPRHNYHVLTARRQGELLAFVIVLVEDHDAYIIDLFGDISPEVSLQLIEAVVDHIKMQPVETLHGLVAEKNLLSMVLQKASFTLRDKAIRVVAYGHQRSSLHALLNKRQNWLLSHVDYLA